MKVTVVSGSAPAGALVEECASDVPGSPPDGLFFGECACADGFLAADAPGASAIPVTAAAVRVQKTDFNIGSPYESPA